jgi:hypothetical protein
MLVKFTPVLLWLPKFRSLVLCLPAATRGFGHSGKTGTALA